MTNHQSTSVQREDRVLRTADGSIDIAAYGRIARSERQAVFHATAIAAGRAVASLWPASGHHPKPTHSRI